MPEVIVTNPVVEPVVTPTTIVTPPATPAKPDPVKTFTQEDVDNFVTTRLAKERARYLKKFGVDDESKLDEIIVKATEHATLKAENETFKAEKLNRDYKDVLGGLNADGEYADILLSQIDKGKNMDEFKANAKAYLDAHPKMLKETYTGFQSGPDLNGKANEPMPNPKDTAAYLRWRSTHNPDGSLIKK
jgi:hypothetical protein